MATAPQPPRPPAPPVPRHTGSNLVAIALLVLALIVVTAVLAVWLGLRFLSHNVRVQVDESAGGKKEVSISTPVGSLEVGKEVNEARLGLPIYPGAKRMKDEGSATVNIGVPDEENFRIVAAKYETPDPLEKVKDFYKEHLGKEVTKFVEKSPEGKTVFEIKHGDQEKVVALEGRASGTQIALVRVSHSREGVN